MISNISNTLEHTRTIYYCSIDRHSPNAEYRRIRGTLSSALSKVWERVKGWTGGMRAEVAIGVLTSRAATTRTTRIILGSSLASLRRGTTRGMVEEKSSQKMVTKAVKGNFRGGIFNAGDAFGLLCAALYERFEQEDEIDRRILKDFSDNMENAPPLSDGERTLIESLTTLSRQVEEQGKRLPGTVKDPVEKFLFWPKGSSNAIGKSVAKIDTSAKELFTYLWALRILLQHQQGLHTHLLHLRDWRTGHYQEL